MCQEGMLSLRWLSSKLTRQQYLGNSPLISDNKVSGKMAEASHYICKFRLGGDRLCGQRRVIMYKSGSIELEPE
jgi:hypothetical protein